MVLVSESSPDCGTHLKVLKLPAVMNSLGTLYLPVMLQSFFKKKSLRRQKDLQMETLREGLKLCLISFL